MPDEWDDNDLRLELSKSGLIVDGGVLYKRDKNAVIARHELSRVTDLRMESEMDWPNFAMGLTAAGSSVPAWQFINSPFWKWLVVIVLGLLVFGSLIDRKRRLLVIETEGQVVRYILKDDKDSCDGFVMSLTSEWKHYWGGRR